MILEHFLQKIFIQIPKNGILLLMKIKRNNEDPCSIGSKYELI